MNGSAPGKWAVRALVSLATIPIVSGCGFRTLKKDIAQASTLAGVEGHSSIQGEDSGPIVVVAYAAEAKRVADLFVLPRPGPFFFALPAGTYRIGAFADGNRDLTYQPDQEPAVLYSDVALEAGERRTGLDLEIAPSPGTRFPFAVTGLTPGQRDIAALPNFHLGTIVDIDDPRFSPENGELGLWNPIHFLFDVGAGVYFLEEYDPQKVPVLFVHGSTGHPAEWKFLISKLDRSRFQPWLLYYPSAPRLDRVGQALVRALAALQTRHQFTQLIMVAHSMGGLVSRAAINYARADAHARAVVRLAALVTISTPWNGHSAAAAGVEHAPVVAPSWEDMAPGSAFLTSLPETALPPECEHFLLFSYGGVSRLSGEANDETVTLSSELSPSIQRQAVRIMGFDEDHTSILRSPEVAAELSAILDRATRPQPEGNQLTKSP